MNITERIQAVKAMEFLARQINDEGIFESWLIDGVADGDIEYGDLAQRKDDAEMLDYYTEDDNFAELLGSFLYCMKRAAKSGGLYCDGITSK